MDRRSTIKNLMLASGSLVALPSWAHSWSVKDLAFTTHFSVEEQAILSSIADTIIPASDSIGAISVGVDKFLERLFSDCYESETQDNIKSLLKNVSGSAEVKQGSSFESCDQEQRQAILEIFNVREEETNSDDEMKSQEDIYKETFKLIKSETIRGFRTSEEVMTKYLDYQVAPAHYSGCVDINT